VIYSYQNARKFNCLAVQIITRLVKDGNVIHFEINCRKLSADLICYSICNEYNFDLLMLSSPSP
jgi:hypothetical protein